MQEFISEDDLKAFDGWLRYQGIDATTLTPEELAEWRCMFEEGKNNAAPKVGLMKLRRVSGEHRYAVAVREDSGLWLTLWVRHSKKGEFFVMVPRGDPGWDVHTSYHLDGTLHLKSFGHKGLSKKLQPLTGMFRGTEHLGANAGHGPKHVGAICNPAEFSGVVEIAPGILGPRDGNVVVDLVEPGCEPIPWSNVISAKSLSRHRSVGCYQNRLMTAHRPNAERHRRALELLSSCRDGCTEAIMLAHGFTTEQMIDLVRAGLATATAERVVAGRHTIEVARVRITEAGRRALTGRQPE